MRCLEQGISIGKKHAGALPGKGRIKQMVRSDFFGFNVRFY
jgi:hypothetical protein